MANRNIRSINRKHAAQLLEKLTQQQLFENANSIYANNTQISAFGQYTIVKKENFCVVYRRKIKIAELTNIRNALSYCIADKYNIVNLRNDINSIDSEISRKENDILFYKHILANSADIELKNTVFNRLIQCNGIVIRLKKRLNKCINSAKYWQQKGFENETSGLGIQKPNSDISKGF